MDTRRNTSQRNVKNDKKQELAGLSEKELLERLFAVACPSCDKQDIRQAAESVSADL